MPCIFRKKKWRCTKSFAVITIQVNFRFIFLSWNVLSSFCGTTFLFRERRFAFDAICRVQHTETLRPRCDDIAELTWRFWCSVPNRGGNVSTQLKSNNPRCLNINLSGVNVITWSYCWDKWRLKYLYAVECNVFCTFSVCANVAHLRYGQSNVHTAHNAHECAVETWPLHVSV